MARRVKSDKEFEITFSVSGYVTQTVKILDPKITVRKLEAMLNSGKALTTIEENGRVAITRSGRKIGEVVYVENNLEYDDFNVEKEDE